MRGHTMIDFHEEAGWRVENPPAQQLKKETAVNAIFTTETTQGRALIVTAWVVGVLIWGGLFTCLQIAFTWTAPWLWACFTFGLIPAAFAFWGVVAVIYWVQKGVWL